MLSTKQKPATSLELDLQTIRRRVADIKRNWTPAEVRERAVEGRQRRKQLEELISQLDENYDPLDETFVC